MVVGRQFRFMSLENDDFRPHNSLLLLIFLSVCMFAFLCMPGQILLLYYEYRQYFSVYICIICRSMRRNMVSMRNDAILGGDDCGEITMMMTM